MGAETAVNKREGLNGRETPGTHETREGLDKRQTTASGGLDTRERRRRSDGERTRQAILSEAARLATVEGIEGLSLSRLASAVGISKSGLFAHFASKEELQLETVKIARDIFWEAVVIPAEASPRGVARLNAYAERFLSHVRESVFPGGCFFASVATELDTRPGPLKDSAMAIVSDWSALLASEVSAAQELGEMDRSLDPAQLAFELDAYLLLANTLFVATGEQGALQRAEQALSSRLDAAQPRP